MNITLKDRTIPKLYKNNTQFINKIEKTKNKISNYMRRNLESIIILVVNHAHTRKSTSYVNTISLLTSTSWGESELVINRLEWGSQVVRRVLLPSHCPSYSCLTLYHKIEQALRTTSSMLLQVVAKLQT